MVDIRGNITLAGPAKERTLVGAADGINLPGVTEAVDSENA